MKRLSKTSTRWASSGPIAPNVPGEGLNTQIHSLGDGALWIALQARKHLQPKRYLVDFYHTCQYLSAAEPACVHPTRWMKTQKNRLKTNHPERVLEALEPHREPPSEQEGQAPVRAAIRYLQNRLDQLDYAGAIAEELPIGSGLIESGHKHVLQSRLKLSGAAWSLSNAQNMANAKTFRANRQWQQYWNNQ